MIFKNIRLRAPEPEDIETIYNWENDPAIWQLSNTITPFSKFILRKYIENSGQSIFESGQLRLMIDLIEKDRTIGAVDLFDFDPINQRAGLGILIADKSERKQGYATMAVEHMIKYSFERLNLHQLYCNILSDNEYSIKLFTSLGFKQVGIKREWIRLSDGFKDEIILQLISGK